MQKRLAVARALLTSPPVLLIDEATHDLDPEAARRVRELVAATAARGAAVAWVTQRLDEIRGFADMVTVLHAGRVRYAGTVPQLMAQAAPRRYLLHLEHDGRRSAGPGRACARRSPRRRRSRRSASTTPTTTCCRSPKG